MTDQSIFDTDGTPAPQEGDQGKNDQPTADQLLGKIVNAEGKPKYDSVEAAINGLAAAQEHISRLESENSDFKSKVDKSNTLQDVMDALKPQGEQEPKGEAPQLDEATLAALLEKVVDSKTAQSTAQANAALVADTFTESFGDQAEVEYYKQAEAEGFTRAEINQLAATKPAAVLKLLDVKVKKQPVGLKTDATPAAFNQSDEGPAKFDPFKPAPNSALATFREVREATNKRLGVET